MMEIENNILKNYTGTDETVIIPDGVTRIGQSAFGRSSWIFVNHCPNLKEIILPDSVRRIDCYAFQHCDTLEHIQLPARLDVIEEYAFFDCKPDRITYQQFQLTDCRNRKLELNKIVLLLTQHDTSVRIPSPEKEILIAQLYCEYPDEKEFIRFLKEKFLMKFSILAEENQTEIIRKLLERGELITKSNINACLYYASGKNRPEIMLLLTDYKHRHFGYEDTETIIKRKLSL